MAVTVCLPSVAKHLALTYGQPTICGLFYVIFAAMLCVKQQYLTTVDTVEDGSLHDGLHAVVVVDSEASKRTRRCSASAGGEARGCLNCDRKNHKTEA